MTIARHGSIFWIHPAGQGPARRPEAITAAYVAWYRKFFHAALDRGVYLPPSPYEVSFTSLAHDDEVLEHALEALVAAGTAIAAGAPARA